MAREQRKVVTVLFCDLTGSTALGESLDPEALNALLARYYEQMRAIVERHGGNVEKFIGDAVMAVFGVPRLHEDDALRAVRAADEMRHALPTLGLQGRIGVMTGEVVTGSDERLATGDAVNVAARLEQAASPGEILIGEPTFALVQQAVDVGELEPLVLKGKSRPVPTFRLLRVLEQPEREHAASFVGRERELAHLGAAFESVRDERRCELVTVVGEAGVGKSRLVAEALAALDATVVRSRCLPYGEGITYWPVTEVLLQLDVLPPGEAAAAAIGALLGTTGGTTSADEIAWAFRKTLEHAASARPLAVVFDDIQWGERTFLDLVEHVALFSTGAPILLCCIARPGLVESHPEWPVALRLGPLGDENVDALIPKELPPELRGRIARAAGGNPLFVEEIVAMAGVADGDLVIPPTLQALLSARVDQLDAAERSVLERGAVEGEIFHRGSVQALGSSDGQDAPQLASLVRKELIRPERPLLPEEDGFRFRHILIRDAAYAALPKSDRATLHERFASWLKTSGNQLVELDEILGYHLEQACRYQAELGLPYDSELAGAARVRLTAAGHRARVRGDLAAAVNLLERATTFVPEGELDLRLEMTLDDALFTAGRSHDALARADALVARATGAGDEVGALHAKVKAAVMRFSVEPDRGTKELAALVEEALPVFETAGDDLALYATYYAVAMLADLTARMDPALEAAERAAMHAREAGLPDELLAWRASFHLYGPTPVPEVLAWCEAHEATGARDPWFQGTMAQGLAMLGRSEEARTLVSDARAQLAEQGGGLHLALINGFAGVDVERLAGDPAAAAEAGAEACRLFEEHGDKGYFSTAAGGYAQALYTLGRLDDAERWAARASELGAADDTWTQMLWRQVRAKLCARRGDHAEAERLAHAAVALCERTDGLNAQGEVYSDLAEVLRLAGRPDEAAAALEQALDRYERKGNVVMAGRVRDLLAPATPTP